ncbi:endonuclease domain-containing protein [Blastococcus sp. SYSU D01042]
MPPARKPPELVGCVFRARDVIGDGLLSRDQLRSTAWRRVLQGVYADADLPDTHAIRIRAARMLAPPSAVVSGRSAAYLLGARGLVDVGTPVEMAVPAHDRFGPVVGLRIRKVAVPPTDLRLVGGFRCTTGLRTALDVARTEPVDDSVPALDVLLAAGIVGLDELRRAAAALIGVRGARGAREAAALADPRAESPPESRLRVLLARAGLPAVPQFVVHDAAGRFVARVDLAYPELCLAVEYDGAWHAEDGQFARDRRRLNRLVAAGWVVLHVTAADLRRPDQLVARLHALRAARGQGSGASDA